MSTNTYSQLPAQLDWEYIQGDATSMAITIATDPAETIDLDAEPVTAMVTGPGRVGMAFDVDVVEPDQVRITPPAGLPPGRYAWWVKWRDRTILARNLNVYKPGTAGLSMLVDQNVIVEYVDFTAAVTIENGGIPGPAGGPDPSSLDLAAIIGGV